MLYTVLSGSHYTEQGMGIWVFGYFLIPILIPKVSKKVFQVFRVNLFTLGKNVFLKIIQFLSDRKLSNFFPVCDMI